MLTQHLEGKDSDDLEAQMWAWRSAHPTAIIKKIYLDEPLQLEMLSRDFGEKLLAPNTMSRRFEYEISPSSEGNNG
jgi:hypothetical protein